MKSKDLTKKLLENNSEFKKEYLKRNLYLEISHIVVRERLKKNLTQKELADLVGTKQSAISRMERGNTLPKIDFLARVYEKLGMYLEFENPSPWPSYEYINSSNNFNSDLPQKLSTIVTSGNVNIIK